MNLSFCFWNFPLPVGGHELKFLVGSSDVSWSMFIPFTYDSMLRNAVFWVNSPNKQQGYEVPEHNDRLCGLNLTQNSKRSTL